MFRESDNEIWTDQISLDDCLYLRMIIILETLHSTLETFHFATISNKVLNVFKVTNRNTRTTSLAYLTPCSGVSIVNFEHIIAAWDFCH